MARRKPKYVRTEEAEKRERSRPKPRQQLAADISQQAPNHALSVPLVYTDTEYTCQRCGKTFVWTAVDQKWWFEVAKGSIYTRARRCDECRKQIRESHAGTPRKSHRDRQSGE